MILSKVRQFVCLFVFYFSVIGGGGGWAKKKNIRGGARGWKILSREEQFFLGVKGKEEVGQRRKF